MSIIPIQVTCKMREKLLKFYARSARYTTDIPSHSSAIDRQTDSNGITTKHTHRAAPANTRDFSLRSQVSLQ